MLTDLLEDIAQAPESLFEDAVWDSFNSWTSSRGISLYPAQEEASLALLAGDNVILATPTGSGKSMVANAAHFIAMARGQRTFYTAPIKALVSEKFFALCEIFGAENVGMMTGDASVNSNAPIIAATAEIVANIALREGKDARIDQVVMDEFHYYSEPERGWAWQVPLLELPKAQFLLMSATLGDTAWLEKDLTERTGRKTTYVGGAERPVPLDFHYVFSPVHETIEELLEDNKAPIYVVHFSQREATERAQALTSMNIITPEEKQRIADEIGDFRFTTTFGKTLSKLVRRGIGVHHAGMLPKYRRLVERLSQTGLLKVICGTDTLGVGINVPIRTVLITGLAKFDGTRQRILKSREFHQIAGRAGRAGYDTEGTVVVEAPEHEIENVKLRRKAGDDPKKLKKIRKKSARDGEVSWSENTFERLKVAEPEELTSQFKVSNSMLLNVVARPGDGYEHMRHLLRTNHNPRAKQNRDIIQAVNLFRGLINAGVVERTPDSPAFRPYTLTQELDRDFALNQPLSPFALAFLTLLDPESDAYTLDVISTFEAILDDPRQLLQAQQTAARGEEIAALKAEGVDYTERMAIIEDVTYPKPLADELEEAFATFTEGNPWAKEFELSPKSVVRDMIEHAMTFSDLIATYGLARSEGVVLRYLTDAWRTLSYSIPDTYMNDDLEDIVVWLGELIRQVDSSLIDEWAHMTGDDQPVSQDTIDRELAFGVEDPTALTANRRAFTIMVRNYFFRLVELFAYEKEDQLEDMLGYLEPDARVDWPAAMDDYFDEYTDVDLGPDARGPEFFRLEDSAGRAWRVTQIIKDPEGDNAFQLHGVVDLDASDEAGEVRLSSLGIREG
ncbi:ski2-like helicase [Corynebacterium afermentans subsp. afermentans]|uniref:Superfamily II RNA helicase n=1 Tax=Corynebacterium afermentans TaxID=38286 RepID=A0A9X8R152_9CORY|nr:DEAD/DEAH box helicase [Corynebacterium afermentans]OAA17774.1 DEAD/DEAH box helicase [Corynebacterium afermentans subsp. afermentans]WJY56921.1 ski2-like helicase [Corynebacterium afermentans subsp. afermentans]SIP99726.1 Superfamily II RNA helicase [Corynebacterium afermentans]